jgi:serine phosphatase RsbU (regulator of sigma subunit)
MPIGIYDDHRPFTCHKVSLRKYDAVYLFSDGFVDQTGGPNKKCYKSKYFKKLLVSVQDKSMDGQKHILEKTMKDWKGSHEQIDDILVMGIRV